MKNVIKLSVLALLIGCNLSGEKNLPTEFDYGKTENGKYTNSFFKMEIPYDTAWFVQSQEETNKMVKDNLEAVTGDDKLLKAQVKASKVNTAYLFTMFKYGLDEVELYNPSIMVIAENVNKFPKVITGEDYLIEVKKLLKRTQMEYTYDSEISEKTVGNKIFHKLLVKAETYGLVINQEYYSTITEGFSLSFVISYMTTEEREELVNIIDGITI